MIRETMEGDILASRSGEDELPNTSGLYEKKAVFGDGSEVDLTQVITPEVAPISLSACLTMAAKLERARNNEEVLALTQTLSDDDLDERQAQFVAGNAKYASYPYIRAIHRYLHNNNVAQVKLTDLVRPSFPTLGLEEALKCVSETTSHDESLETIARELQKIRDITAQTLLAAERNFLLGEVGYQHFPYLRAIRNILPPKRDKNEQIFSRSKLAHYVEEIAKIETRASGSKEPLTNKGAIELLISLKRTDLEMMLAAYESKNPPDPRYNHLPFIIAARHLLKTELGYVSDPETWELRKAPEEK